MIKANARVIAGAFYICAAIVMFLRIGMALATVTIDVPANAVVSVKVIESKFLLQRDWQKSGKKSKIGTLGPVAFFKSHKMLGRVFCVTAGPVACTPSGAAMLRQQLGNPFSFAIYPAYIQGGDLPDYVYSFPRHGGEVEIWIDSSNGTFFVSTYDALHSLKADAGPYRDLNFNKHFVADTVPPGSKASFMGCEE